MQYHAQIHFFTAASDPAMRSVLAADNDRVVLPGPDTKALMRRLILIAALVSLPVAGGDVYKCKGPKGEITFTNIKCPANTEAEHYSTYEPQPEPPPPAPVPTEAAAPPVATVNSAAPIDQPGAPTVPASVSPAVHPFTSPVVQPPAPSEPPVAAPASSAATGYKCADGENVWLQSNPCPPATAQPVARPSEPSTPAAAPVTAATAVTPTAANPQATSQGALCDQLIAQTASPEHQKDRAGFDELNKLLAANGCKR